ncbi:MAG: SLBB domain-containing protein [Bacteroidaceae bacterium]|nr:SLBB domain-containing protein [Bacteroidaceae bacterium]
MKRSLLAVMLCLAAIVSAFGQMSDTQVMDFVRSETKRGTSQSQIVTSLMQRGVQIEQIRRIRNQYDEQIKQKGLSGAADGAVSMAVDRMQGNGDGTTAQELTTARRGTTGEVYQDAAEDHAEEERDVMATQNVQGEAAGKRVFGRDIFNQRALSFEPNMNLATPQNYVLGPGDQLVIDIYGASQKTLIYTVSPEGTITVANVGPVAVNGLTVSEAQRKIRSTVGAHYSTSDVRLTLGQTRTIMINVMGEVKTPGTYQLSAFATVFHALYRAGGINQLGTLRNVKVYRNGRLVTVVDIYEYILNGRLAGNVMLQDGDVIQVDPYECLVGITGNVKRPMYYEMRKSETVGTLIKYAGGFTGDAYKKMVRLVRQTGERYTVHNIDEFEMNAFTLDDGDVVSVDAILNRYENMVEIKGAVFRPGMFNLNGDVCSVRSLIQAAAGLTEDAFLDHAIIHRLKEDRSLEVIPVDVKGIMDGTAADIPLKNEDVVFIPTQEELRKERFFTITGEVMTPGTYQYADNTTIEDLIVQAGGLRDGASLARVDVSRRIDDPYSTEKTRDISETFQFDLKDGLVVNEARQFILKPYDVVHVRRSPGYVMPKNITVTGEVNYEGAFTLEKKNLRLTDAIQMAGGVTIDAYIKGARLIRQMSEEERIRKTAVLENIRNTLSEKDSIAWGKIDLQNTYVIGIDLEKALANPGSPYDIVLRENDQIEIPEYNGTVAIAGDVQFPNTVTYVDGKNYKWYVQNAGGFSETAKKKKMFVVYQNGMMDKVSRNTKIEPGSQIFVPSKKKKNVDLGNLAVLGSVLTPLATMVALISYLTK